MTAEQAEYAGQETSTGQLNEFIVARQAIQAVRATEGIAESIEPEEVRRKQRLQECAEHLELKQKLDIGTKEKEHVHDLALALFSYVSLEADASEERSEIERNRTGTQLPLKPIMRFDVETIMTAINGHVRQFRSGKATEVSPIHDQEDAEIKVLRSRLTRPLPTSGDLEQPALAPVEKRGDAFPEVALTDDLLLATQDEYPVAHRALEIVAAMMGKNLPPLPPRQ